MIGSHTWEPDDFDFDEYFGVTDKDERKREDRLSAPWLDLPENVPPRFYGPGHSSVNLDNVDWEDEHEPNTQDR